VSLRKLLPHLTRFRLLAFQRIGGVWHLDLSAWPRSAACPHCRQHSTAVHSVYRRTVADLPIAGTRVLFCGSVVFSVGTRRVRSVFLLSVSLPLFVSVAAVL
jgi:hypothetical protein